MEQNELAIIADSHNNAIFVFTGVTIIFLPLSFFTSYYGMNVKGIQDTSENTKYFWKICGSAAFVIVMVTIAFGLRNHIRRRLSRPTQVKRFVA